MTAVEDSKTPLRVMHRRAGSGATTRLCWFHADGRLCPDSDPLPALLEPLRCYGGLGADGHPVPEGTDVDFACQCYLPYDPTCPPGLAQHIVGCDPDTWREFVTRAHIRRRADDPPVSSYEPLVALARRLRSQDSCFAVHPDEFTYVGMIDPAASTPALWLYTYAPTRRRGFDDLAVDADGNPWVPKPDRRRRAGFRWARLADRAALLRSGVDPSSDTPGRSRRQPLDAEAGWPEIAVLDRDQRPMA